MPPKPIIDSADILAAALSIVRTNGIENVNARSIAKALNCSTKPLFRLYKNMDDLKQSLFSKMNQHCSDYIQEYSEFKKDYIGVALRYISYAKIEPNVFKALFMNNAMTKDTISNMLTDGDIKELLKEISTTAKVNEPGAQAIYKRMFLLSHGIASIIATNGDLFEMEEVKSILADTYQGIVLSVKQEGDYDAPGSK